MYTQAADVLSACVAQSKSVVLCFSKTVSMCFSIKKLDLKRYKINSQNENIHLVTEFKSLGLVLDPQLKCDKHMKKISKTIQN